jgi:hypothetical protein
LVYKTKTWEKKLFNLDFKLHKIGKILFKLQKLWGKGTIVILHTEDALKIINCVKERKLIKINILNQKCVKKYGIITSFLIYMGIFSLIVVRYADEQGKMVNKKITYYWKTLKGNGVLNEKYSYGIINQKVRLECEALK